MSDDYGYSHWTGKPVTPDVHELALVPQSIADGWEGYCSCGQWHIFKTFYEFDTKDNLIAAIWTSFDVHVAKTESKKLGG